MPEPISSQSPSQLYSHDPSFDEPNQSIDNNAQRTTAQSSIGPYADAGVTGSGDAVHAGAAALKGRDPANYGLEVEVFSVSGQVGGEMEAQGALARLGLSGTRGSVTAEFLTARAHGGSHNDDGSTGVNVGAGATGAGVEGTLALGESSITGGVALSLGASASLGVRDQDGDGAIEVCAKVSVGFATLGFCAEN